MLCLRSLCCYALNCIHIWGFYKGLRLGFLQKYLKAV